MDVILKLPRRAGKSYFFPFRSSLMTLRQRPGLLSMFQGPSGILLCPSLYLLSMFLLYAVWRILSRRKLYFSYFFLYKKSPGSLRGSVSIIWVKFRANRHTWQRFTAFQSREGIMIHPHFRSRRIQLLQLGVLRISDLICINGGAEWGQTVLYYFFVIVQQFVWIHSQSLCYL